MKAINGHLDMSHNYKLIQVDYGELTENAEQCENCGQIIANVAVVQRDDNKVYRIGLDCLTTIVNMSPNEQQQAKNIINRRRRFIKVLKNDVKSIIVKGNTFWMYDFIAENWNANFRGRGDYSLYKNLIIKLEIPVIEEVV